MEDTADKLGLIVGLGNPGKVYASTRHNVGWMVLDLFAERNGLKFKDSKKFKGYIAVLEAEERIILLKPTTYMNKSGESVCAVCNFFKIEHSRVLVILDDLDLPVGRIRLRTKGSSGGHKGLDSIIRCLGSTYFPRLKIGIGKPFNKNEVVDYVLSPFGNDEVEKMELSLKRACECLEQIIKDGSIGGKILSECNREVSYGG